MSRSTTNRRRSSKKHEQESNYEQLFPPYEPVHQYSIYFLNEATREQDVDALIDMTRNITQYVIDTESNCSSYTPALIQIFCIQSPSIQSPLMLVEVDYLPPTSSSLFLKFKQLFSNIFSTTSHLYCWGSLSSELSQFVRFQLFTLPISSVIHNIQQQFKSWFNHWISHSHASSNNNHTNEIGTIDRPTSNPKLLLSPHQMNNNKQTSNESWSLQHAVLYIFEQYLSKRDTLHKWSIGLDVALSSRNMSYSSNHRQRLIRYAAYDCLSIAHLLLVMCKSNIPFDQLEKNHANIQKKSKKKSNFTKVSTIFQLDDDDDSSSSEIYLHEVKTVHVEDESLSISPPVETVHDKNERLLTEIVYNNEPPPTSIETDQLHDAKVQNPTPSSFIIKSRSRRRSKASQLRRNRKTSLRHRINRYRHELTRPVNMNITRIKQILREKQVKYTNINVVRSVLYVGLKSADHKQKYEQLLPTNLFL